ncbi:hypothetical protein DSO57_1011710 [Entomophthora muscae]|uniref:Uncharacterized protein n=1 Tax=Entomophthora muscae TaxID=34485 RepID=A0ACC2SJL6_9FUNG|nr:hypothetical protein DSO57_1011710 [Entomophthora muscae]
MNMKLNSLAFILSSLLVLVSSQEEESSSGDDSGDSGQAATTDTTSFAGVYSFVYYYNQDPNAKPTTQLPCKNSTSFLLTIPEGEGGDVVREANGIKDPIYHTSQGDWTVMEVGKGNGFNILKMNLYYNDAEEMIACWALKKNGRDIVANINPRKLSECPTKYVPLTDTCTLTRAAIYGTCISGGCNGTLTKTTTSNNSFRSTSSAFYLAILSTLSLLIN